ncbi:MAG: Holliday junction resolvase RuvX [Candidatus Rokubacteria bacterium]|nr:Holliday junction resolvase RuvX [Candidatus Rokubacteria bacterium]
MRVLALDVGDRSIGLAVSDELGLTAQALETLTRRGLRADLAALRRIVEERQIDEVVVGLPLRLDGRIGPQAEKVQGLVEALRTVLPVPVCLWDERLTTQAAERALLEGGVRRARRKQVVDQVAAALILQGYLDRKRHGRDAGTER